MTDLSGVRRLKDDGWRELTWMEYAKELEIELLRAARFTNICMDLDRCEHGRHEGDVCSGCGGNSHGNPWRPKAGQRLGYTIDRKEIIIPGRENKHEPAQWIQ